MSHRQQRFESTVRLSQSSHNTCVEFIPDLYTPVYRVFTLAFPCKQLMVGKAFISIIRMFTIESEQLYL